MALWDKIDSRGDVEDRRMVPGVGAGSLGLTGIAIVVAITLLTGGSATDVINNLQGVQIGSPTQNINTKSFEGKDNYENFTATVLGSLNDVWSPVFSQLDKVYTSPKLVLFRGSTQSACGGAQSLVGPHYCPVDQTIYLDETFFEELQSRFGSKGGDVAEAYVIAHEVGHHVQNELGIMNKLKRIKNNNNKNELSIKLELQADCFAGLWAYSLKDKGIFEQGEILEAIDAASAVGDDSIQKRSTGEIHPESWTHGSSNDRAAWFNKGYETGSVVACDTFSL
jgi:predicted metalloprotease